MDLLVELSKDSARKHVVDAKIQRTVLTMLVSPPAVQESIFSTISRLARQHDAINLGQGFPDFEPDEALTDRLAYHVKQAHNQYAPMAGVPRLLQAIGKKTFRSHGVQLDTAVEITITSGATQALWTAIQATVSLGDEVIIFEPAYDSYAPAVRSKGGVVVPLQLRGPDFRPDWGGFAERLNDKTRLVIINNPHNPTGKCWQHEDFQELERLLADTDTLLLSDEVYEHLVYDGREHLSVLRYPQLRQRALVTSSFGKTFHVTGWKVGYIVAPAQIMTQFRSLHQFTVFTVNTPAQHAIADHLQDENTYESLPDFFAAKRDHLYKMLAPSKLKLLPSEGSYFGLADYSLLSEEPDTSFAERLIIEAGVAVIPISPFYSIPPQQQSYVRLCFAKREATLSAAAQRLTEWAM